MNALKPSVKIGITVDLRYLIYYNFKVHGFLQNEEIRVVVLGGRERDV